MANCYLKFDEKQMMFDLLNSQKFAASLYNADHLECATPEVARCIWGILEDEHRIANEIFTEANSRGLYPTETAKEEKLHEAKQKYGQCLTV